MPFVISPPYFALYYACYHYAASPPSITLMLPIAMPF